MNNLSSFPVITPRDSRSIKALFSEIRHGERLSAEEEDSLCRLAAAGDISARNKLVSSNLLFVVRIAKEYVFYNIPFEDVISFGYSGLIHAAESFDPSVGVRFLSYAVRCIRSSINHEMAEYTRPVHVPSNVLAKISKLRHAVDDFIMEQGYYPSDEQLSERLSWDFDGTFLSCPDDTCMLSIDAPITDDADDTFEFFMTSSDITDSSLMKESLKKDLDRSLLTLGERDASIMRELYGIGCESSTIEDVARHYGLSRERVRQIQRDSIALLRNKCEKLLYKYTA